MCRSITLFFFCLFCYSQHLLRSKAAKLLRKVLRKAEKEKWLLLEVAAVSRLAACEHALKDIRSVVASVMHLLGLPTAEENSEGVPTEYRNKAMAMFLDAAMHIERQVGARSID